MKFYGHGIVWDAKNDKPLAKFSRAESREEKGVFETEDERVIAELERLGYPHDGETPESDAPKPFSRMNLAELEAAAKEMEVDLSDCKNNKERVAKLAEAKK